MLFVCLFLIMWLISHYNLINIFFEFYLLFILTLMLALCFYVLTHLLQYAFTAVLHYSYSYTFASVINSRWDGEKHNRMIQQQSCLFNQ